MSHQTYYVPAQSRWPILASIALFLLAYGAGTLINGLKTETGNIGLVLVLSGALMMALILFGWFRHIINESMEGKFSPQADLSFRWGMSWFIFSEIMFFIAFFGALFYVRTLAVPWLGGEGEKGVSNMLWEGFVAEWPLLTTPDMQQFPGAKAVIDPWHLPLINTAILISSSFTITLAHHALKAERRTAIVLWQGLTILLGITFLSLQVIEYAEAYQELGLTLHSGVYGATFFMLTGFHGLHVTMGTLMLIITWLRVIKGHFTPDNHFGFEAVAWYWHFVDVVWVGLFLFVYVF
jgi:cytochrome c oxidase subunit 3